MENAEARICVTAVEHLQDMLEGSSYYDGGGGASDFIEEGA